MPPAPSSSPASPGARSAGFTDLPLSATHRDVESRLRAEGWMPCGAGDWAIALESPQREVVARISPFDPVGPYTVRLYRTAARTGMVPRLMLHRRLDGGGDLQVMERLEEVPGSVAAAFHEELSAAAPPGSRRARLVQAVREIHDSAREELPWCGEVDTNPSNVMRRPEEGTIVLLDPYFADGPALFDLAINDPDRFVSLLDEEQRRYMTEIPLGCSGPWSATERAALRDSLLRADARRAR